uniref:Putative ovule protein n=1 Tax=Solanum chacoense TaxID=4108 RepID=A0A0V0HNS5_SOLCH
MTRKIKSLLQIFFKKSLCFRFCHDKEIYITLSTFKSKHYFLTKRLYVFSLMKNFVFRTTPLYLPAT